MLVTLMDGWAGQYPHAEFRDAGCKRRLPRPSIPGSAAILARHHCRRRFAGRLAIWCPAGETRSNGQVAVSRAERVVHPELPEAATAMITITMTFVASAILFWSMKPPI
jgi:hypothetical protein